MHAHEEIIRDFYECFSRGDGEGMVKHYAQDVRFSDPVFTDLRGDQARAMWRMLTSRAADLRVEFRDVRADEATGSAHWDARYTFSPTGRAVLNRIDASFRFEGGKIIEHRDVFDLWAWTRMALGPVGYLLGWGPLQGTVRANARKELEKYMARHPSP
jgi:ketosteroid isomerase-like protein